MDVIIQSLGFKHSDNLAICQNLAKNFEDTNTKKKYKSDLEVLIRESKLEDLYHSEREIIFVSTIHKAKGKEFDNIFLMLESTGSFSGDLSRQIYVAITRAKQNLTIHTDTHLFDNITAGSLEYIERLEKNELPTQLVIQLTHKDVWLDYFLKTESVVSSLTAGAPLAIEENGCMNIDGQSVLKFSQTFRQRIKDMQLNGYDIKSGKVNFILYWLKEDTQQEIKILLPKIYFEKHFEKQEIQ